MNRTNTIALLDEGFACLVEKLGIVNAERFVAMIQGDRFDYTIWHREYFQNMDLEQIHEEAVQYAKTHPHEGRGQRI